jgi:hypothetical protein
LYCTPTTSTASGRPLRQGFSPYRTLTNSPDSGIASTASSNVFKRWRIRRERLAYIGTTIGMTYLDEDVLLEGTRIKSALRVGFNVYRTGNSIKLGAEYSKAEILSACTVYPRDFCFRRIIQLYITK